MKKTIFILITLITLVSCNKPNNPLTDYADKMGIVLVESSIVINRDYCAIDSIRYYENLLNKKSIELKR